MGIGFHDIHYSIVFAESGPGCALSCAVGGAHRIPHSLALVWWVDLYQNYRACT